jgi:hypothetical protein
METSVADAEAGARQQALRDTLNGIRETRRELDRLRAKKEAREVRHPLHDGDSRASWGHSRPATAPSRGYSVGRFLAPTGCQTALTPAEYLSRTLHVSREFPDRFGSSRGSSSSSGSPTRGVSLSQPRGAVATAQQGRLGFGETSTSLSSSRHDTARSRHTAWVKRHLADSESRDAMIAAYAMHRYAPRFAPGSHTDLVKAGRVEARTKQCYMEPTTWPCAYKWQPIYM